VLEPAIRIDDLDAVQDIDDVVGLGGGIARFGSLCHGHRRTPSQHEQGDCQTAHVDLLGGRCYCEGYRSTQAGGGPCEYRYSVLSTKYRVWSAAILNEISVGG